MIKLTLVMGNMPFYVLPGRIESVYLDSNGRTHIVMFSGDTAMVKEPPHVVMSMIGIKTPS